MQSPLDVVPSIGLGTSRSRSWRWSGRYATIANDGLRRSPQVVTRIETASGQVLDRFGGAGRQVLTRRDAGHLVQMLRAAVDRGTGQDLRRLGATGDLAGKTGTTQGYADGWFIAMRPGLAVGAWVGFNDQRVTFRSKATGEGSKTALPIVANFLARVQDRLPEGSLPTPPEPFRYAFEADSLADDPWDDVYGTEDAGWGYDPSVPLRDEGAAYERPDEDRPALRPSPEGERPVRVRDVDRGRIEPSPPRAPERGGAEARTPAAPRQAAPPRERGRPARESQQQRRDDGRGDGPRGPRRRRVRGG